MSQATSDLKELWLLPSIEAAPSSPAFSQFPAQRAGESGLGGLLTRKSSCWQGHGETPAREQEEGKIFPVSLRALPSGLPNLS